MFAGFDRKKAVLIDAMKHPFFETVLINNISRVITYDVLFVRNYPAKRLTDDYVYPISDAKQLVIATHGRHALTGSIDVNIFDFSHFNSVDKIEMFELYTDWAKAELNKIALPHVCEIKDASYLINQYDTVIQEAKHEISKRISIFNKLSQKYPKDFNCKVKESA